MDLIPQVLSGDQMLTKCNLSILNNGWKILTEMENENPTWPDFTNIYLDILFYPLMSRVSVKEMLTQLARESVKM